MAKDRGSYVVVYQALIDSPEYGRLSRDAAAVFWALKVCPENNRLGIFPYFNEQVIHRAKVDPEKAQDALRELERERWILTEDRWLWIRNHLKFDPHFSPENPKQVAGLLKKLASMPHIALVSTFVKYYKRLGFIPKTYRYPIDSLSIPVTVTNTNTNTNTPAEDTLAVFEHWRSTMPGREDAKLTPGRREKIEARRKEGYSVADLFRAIDGCRASAFHQGANDQKTKYNDLTLICRNGEKVEFFKGKAEPEKVQAKTLVWEHPRDRAIREERERIEREAKVAGEAS